MRLARKICDRASYKDFYIPPSFDSVSRKNKSLAFDHFQAARATKQTIGTGWNWIRVLDSMWCDMKAAGRKGFVCEASVCPTIRVSRRSPPGKSRISLRSDAFPPDSWPALGLQLADGCRIASVCLPFFPLPPPLSIRDPFRYAYAARNYGPCVSRGHPRWFMSLPESLR